MQGAGGPCQEAPAHLSRYYWPRHAGVLHCTPCIPEPKLPNAHSRAQLLSVRRISPCERGRQARRERGGEGEGVPGLPLTERRGSWRRSPQRRVCSEALPAAAPRWSWFLPAVLLCSTNIDAPDQRANSAPARHLTLPTCPRSRLPSWQAVSDIQIERLPLTAKGPSAVHGC